MRCIGKSIVIHVDHHLDNLSHLKIVITSQKYSILFSSQCVFDSNVYLLTLILSFVVRSAVNLDIYLPKLAVFGSCFRFPNDWHLFPFYWPVSNSSKSDRMNMQIFHSKSSHTNTLKHMPIHIPFFFWLSCYFKQLAPALQIQSQMFWRHENHFVCYIQISHKNIYEVRWMLSCEA